MFQVDEKPSRPAMWTSRVALFSAGLLLSALLLHRLFWMTTPVLINLVALAYAGATLSVLLALAAFVVIWRRGSPGTPRILFALVVTGAMFAWPASMIPAVMSLPPINDISTDLVSPPPYTTLATVRADTAANTAKYPGAKFAEAQKKAYPDITPYFVDRSVEETYEIAVATLQRMKMRIVHEELPNPRAGQPGVVEATDLTMVLGFVDDVVMRVSLDNRRARVDIRSASRFGTHDLGRNALRIRSIVKELAARIEATVPIPAEGGQKISAVIPQRDLKGKISKLMPKRPKERDPTIIAPQPLQDPAQADAQRGPAQKAKLRPQDERRGRDRRPRQSPE